MSDRRDEGEAAEQGKGLARRCHLTGEIVESEVWYTRTVETDDGRRKRVYASPEAYWQLSEADRRPYRRETVLSESKGARPPAALEAREGGERETGRHPEPQATSETAPRSGAPVAGDGTTVIGVDGLAKTYPDGTEAVKGVSFDVRQGEIFGLLGPNGAGKSTLIGMLGTLVKPTGGRATVAGFDVEDDPGRIKPILGFALQEVGVDELATGREFLMLQARLFGIGREEARRRAEELLELVGLTEAADKRIEGYSGGMKRKVDLASALIHRPDIIFLDEPTEGLDPRARQEMWQLLEGLRADTGATILLSTHYMEEADRLCDRLAIIDQGCLVARGTPEALKASIGQQSIVLEFDGADPGPKLRKAEAILAEAGLDGGRVHRTETQLHIYVDDPARSTPKVLRLMETKGLPPDSLQIQKATLDDVYLSTTGRSIQEAEAAESQPEAIA